jgi:hypothetical protein
MPNFLDRLVELEQKSKQYLNEGESPPQGQSVFQGPRGGRYYEPIHDPTAEERTREVTPKELKLDSITDVELSYAKEVWADAAKKFRHPNPLITNLALNSYFLMNDVVMELGAGSDSKISGIKSERGLEGFIAIKPYENEIYIDKIATAPWNINHSKRRRRGTGSQMLASVFNIALKNEKIERVRVEAITGSKGFYSKIGFVPVEDSKAYLAISRENMEQFLKRYMG